MEMINNDQESTNSKHQEVAHQLRRPFSFLGLSEAVFKVRDQLISIRFRNQKGQIMEDELDQIKQRIELGYGLSSSENLGLFQKEVKKIEQEIEFNNDDFNLFTELNDFWEWIQKCINYKKEFNNSNMQAGFKWKNSVDPSNGFKYIIEVGKEQNNLPKPNNYCIFGHQVYETDKRIQALNICGWQELYILQNNRYENQQNTPEKKLTTYLDKLFQEGQQSKAVAIAVFHFDFSKAYEYINKIDKDYDHNALSFMKYILKGLDNIQSVLEKDQNLKNLFYQKKDNKQSEVFNSRNNDCKSDWETLKKVNIFHESFQSEFLNKIQDKQMNIQFSYFLSNIMPFIKNMCASTNFKDPYFKAICNFISNNQNPILYELRIPLFDRLAFAIRFYDSKKLESLFQNYEEAAKSKGILGSIILTGQSQASVEILQKYLDIKSDIQTVGLASIYLRIFKVIGEKKQQEWYGNYQALLNRLGLFGERVKLDKQYQRLMETFLPNEGKIKDTFQSPFVIQKCNFCQCKNDHQSLLQKMINKNQINGTSVKPENRMESSLEKALLFNCQKCLKPFPNCAICLLPITVRNPFLEGFDNRQNVNEVLELEESVFWCQNCKHGGHYKHIIDWFQDYNICPVSDCICECSLL